jgi:signal peptidase II
LKAAVRPLLAWARAGLVLLVVVAADQLSKHAIEHSIIPGEEHGFLPGIELVNTRNHGVAFGFLPGHHVVVSIIVGIALLALLIYFLRHAARPLIWLPTGMLIGGAAGNILDRLRHGSVTDFIKLPLGWPPFNLADSAITVGVLLLVLLIEGDGVRKAAAPDANLDSDSAARIGSNLDPDSMPDSGTPSRARGAGAPE